MTGFSTEFMYPSQKAIANALDGITQFLQAAFSMYRKKNGSQQAMKLPIIKPRMRVALFSFFLANLFFSLSGSLGLWGLGSAGSSSDLLGCDFSCLLSVFLKILSLRGLTPPQRLTTPESDDEGSISETMSASMATLGARPLVCWSCSSPFTESVELLSGQDARGFFVTCAAVVITCGWDFVWEGEKAVLRSKSKLYRQNIFLVTI